MRLPRTLTEGTAAFADVSKLFAGLLPKTETPTPYYAPGAPRMPMPGYTNPNSSDFFAREHPFVERLRASEADKYPHDQAMQLRIMRNQKILKDNGWPRPEPWYPPRTTAPRQPTEKYFPIRGVPPMHLPSSENLRASSAQWYPRDQINQLKRMRAMKALRDNGWPAKAVPLDKKSSGLLEAALIKQAFIPLFNPGLMAVESGAVGGLVGGGLGALTGMIGTKTDTPERRKAMIRRGLIGMLLGGGIGATTGGVTGAVARHSFLNQLTDDVYKDPEIANTFLRGGKLLDSEAPYFRNLSSSDRELLKAQIPGVFGEELNKMRVNPFLSLGENLSRGAAITERAAQRIGAEAEERAARNGNSLPGAIRGLLDDAGQFLRGNEEPNPDKPKALIGGDSYSGSIRIQD